MATLSSFLSLTLPAFNEFFDSWGDVNNQNLETLDTYLADLRAGLITGGAISDWSPLAGTAGSLADRLAVSIQPSGAIDLSSSPELLDLSRSNVRGKFYQQPGDVPSAGLRFEDSDFELHAANQPFSDGRFSKGDPAGAPNASFPHEDIDAGVAFRSRDFGSNTAEPLSAPEKPWSPGLVQGGDSSYLTAPAGANQILLNSSAAAPAVFNIDGYVFRVRESILLEYSLGQANNEWIWVYVSRDNGDYNDANFKYSESGGTPIQKDLRRLKEGTDGVAANVADPADSTFTSATGTFDTAPWKARAGDTLVVENTDAAGSYVIKSVISNTQLAIEGRFPIDVGAITYHVLDNWMPNIGAVIPTSNPTQTYAKPPYEPGRVYIGRVQHQTSPPNINATTWRRNGVYDSGWILTQSAATVGLTPINRPHNLGVPPSRVEIWVRESATSPDVYAPIVRREFLMTTGPLSDFLQVPSLRYWFNETDIWVRNISDNSNALSGALPPAFFTDDSGTHQATADVRILCWR